ncbi:hypothetical protein [Desulfonatronovibrio magnus]|uniref:hypothetical protein n=1 Tax=Desulfonatronovibrio magnus TaxID=698827 RepID=UPI000698EF0B|nr:hypothetical protein [Desulfonatronovibrio magnus]
MLSEKDFLTLGHPRLYFSMFWAGLQRAVRQKCKHLVVQPVENTLLSLWQYNHPFGSMVQNAGLSRRSIEQRFARQIRLLVPVCLLTDLVKFDSKYERRRLANRFIWDGDWDESIVDFTRSFRYRFMADIWQHRDDLTKSTRYKELVSLIAEGRPYRSYHKGVYLDTEQKVVRFLEIYLAFMYQLQKNGYDDNLAPDPIGVAVDRNGRLVKINKGLHRLAMAMQVGLASIPVCVRAVHRIWWERHTRNVAGEEAVENVISNIRLDLH